MDWTIKRAPSVLSIREIIFLRQIDSRVRLITGIACNSYRYPLACPEFVYPALMTCINNMLDDRHARFMRSKNGKTPRATLKNIAPSLVPPSSASCCFNRFFLPLLEAINLDVGDGKLGTSSLKTLRAGQVSLNEKAFTRLSVFSEVTIPGLVATEVKETRVKERAND